MKYHNKPIKTDEGRFDSQKEYARWQELKLMERAGVIKNLRRQVKIELIPAQKNDGEVVERACDYIADFVYFENGREVYEDCKGVKTKDYIIKRKLMLYRYGVKVRET